MRLRAPLSESTVRSLRLGEEVYLSGQAFTGRDEAHQRALEYIERGMPLPFDLHDGVLYHCGPIMERQGEGWRVLAAGPTTSSRLDRLEPRFIAATGVRAIIGKGGMSAPTLEAMHEKGCVYLAFPGGAAVLAAQGISSVKGVQWSDLGMPEAVWELELQDFGPLIVAMDAHGNSIYDQVASVVTKNLEQIKKRL